MQNLSQTERIQLLEPTMIYSCCNLLSAAQQFNQGLKCIQKVRQSNSTVEME